jgi:hypothetical protein
MKLYVDGLSNAEAGNDGLKFVELPGPVESFQARKDRDPSRPPPEARPRSDGTTLMESRELRGSIKRGVTPDLRSHCPVCGNAYQPGEGVLALACLSFATGAVPAAPAGGCDPIGNQFLGHHGCVLPRLLTLLAGFQPEPRFVKAATALSARESGSPEYRHDET